jgi:hypothetical protein
MGSSCKGFGGYSEVSVSGQTTLEQEKKIREASGAPAPTPSNSAAAYVQDQRDKRDPKNLLGFSVAPPPAAPDLTEQALKARRTSQMMQLLSGRGRRQAFMGGYGPSALKVETGT